MRDMYTKRQSIMLGVSLHIGSFIFAYLDVVYLSGATWTFETHDVRYVGQPTCPRYNFILFIVVCANQHAIVVQVPGSFRSRTQELLVGSVRSIDAVTMQRWIEMRAMIQDMIQERNGSPYMSDLVSALSISL